MMRWAPAFRKQGVHRPTQSQTWSRWSLSGQTSAVTRQSSNWPSTGVYPSPANAGVDGYRGVYHRAGRRPDPLAPPNLRN